MWCEVPVPVILTGRHPCRHLQLRSPVPPFLPLHLPLCSLPRPQILGRAHFASFFGPPSPAASSPARARDSASTPRSPTPGGTSGTAAPPARRLDPPSGGWLRGLQPCIEPALPRPERAHVQHTASGSTPARRPGPPPVHPPAPSSGLSSLASRHLDTSFSLTSAPATNAQLRRGRASLPVRAAASSARGPRMSGTERRPLDTSRSLPAPDASRTRPERGPCPR